MALMIPSAVCVSVALLLAFLVQLLHQRLDLSAATRWVPHNLGLFLTGALPILGLLLFWLGALDSLVLSVCITAVIAAGMGYTNYLMLYYREQPLVSRDLSMALNLDRLLTMVSPGSVAVLATGLVLAAAAAVVLRITVPSAPLPTAYRIGLSLSGLIVFIAFCRAGKDKSVARRLMIFSGADFATYQKNGDAIAAFDRNGFLAAFFSLCMRPIMEAPEHYSKQAVAKITARYSASSLIATARSPHILFVMSEAFSDPLALDNITFSEDPIPNIRAIMRDWPSGQILAPGFGGGTAHCEFEALTGFSTGLTGGISPFENNINKQNAFPSIARQLRDKGYHTVALHPYKRGMYARTEAYPALGLDTFIDVDGMRHTGRVDNNPYVSDASAYNEILDVLRERTDPLFLHLVTMQNHGDYIRTGRFHTTIRAEGLEKPVQVVSVENYIQGLRHSDTATAAFLDALSALKEEVVVLFWGDHLPSAYPPDRIRSRGRENYETPFFLWANFPLRNRDYGTRSPMMLPTLLREAAGLSMSPFDRFLLELQNKLHGVHVRFAVDAGGHTLPRDALDGEANQYLDELHLLQYDTMLGNRYAEQLGFFTLNAADA